MFSRWLTVVPHSVPRSGFSVRGGRRWRLVRRNPTKPQENFSLEIQLRAYFRQASLQAHFFHRQSNRDTG
jgi:hypothetical protein